METEPTYQKLRELSWRRKLNAAEERELREWLAAHPEAQEPLDLETGLTEVLAKLPDVPLASNFTARVLQAVEREAMAQARGEQARKNWWRRLPRWLPRVASAAVVITAGLFGYQHYSKASHELLARQMAEFKLPDPEILTNFEAIRIVSQTPAPDDSARSS